MAVNRIIFRVLGPILFLAGAVAIGFAIKAFLGSGTDAPPTSALVAFFAGFVVLACGMGFLAKGFPSVGRSRSGFRHGFIHDSHSYDPTEPGLGSSHHHAHHDPGVHHGGFHSGGFHSGGVDSGGGSGF